LDTTVKIKDNQILRSLIFNCQLLGVILWSSASAGVRERRTEHVPCLEAAAAAVPLAPCRREGRGGLVAAGLPERGPGPGAGQLLGVATEVFAVAVPVLSLSLFGLFLPLP